MFCLLFLSQHTERVNRATGVTTAMVENMEENFKKDILRELRKGSGRILLHDEVEERPGVFSIIPIWEVVPEEGIMTPRDVFNLVIKEGYRVSLSTSFRCWLYSKYISLRLITVGLPLSVKNLLMEIVRNLFSFFLDR